MTPEQLDKLERAIEKLRLDCLLGPADENEPELDRTGLCPEAEAFYLLALDTLSAARRFTVLALYAQRKALANGRM